MTRPRGNPPMPSAISRPSEPVEITSVSTAALARAELHDRTLAEGAFDLSERRVQCLALSIAIPVHEAQRWPDMWPLPYSIPNAGV